MVGDAFGDMDVQHVSEHQLGVEMLGVVTGRDAIEGVMSGWEDAMPQPDGVAWLRDRVAHAAEHARTRRRRPPTRFPKTEFSPDSDMCRRRSPDRHRRGDILDGSRVRAW